MRITLPSGTPAEIARPPDEAAEPAFGLVVIPDIMGLRPLFDEHVQRLADDNGWVVVAFELFPGMEDQPLEWRLENGGMLDDDRVLADAVAAADWTGCERVGILGFCMGGMFTLKAAGTGRFHRAVAFYGMIRVPHMWHSATQREPLDYLNRPQACPIMEIGGTDDQWVPAADLEALSDAGAEIVVYENADHGFAHDPTRPTYRPDDAADAWRRALGFLDG